MTNLKKPVNLRNPLTHFRHVDDEHNLDRRSIATGRLAGESLSNDAWFAISLPTRMLAKQPFRLGRHSYGLDLSYLFDRQAPRLGNVLFRDAVGHSACSR